MLSVIDHDLPDWLIRSSRFRVVDYMDDRSKYQPIDGDAPVHLYVRSAFNLKSKRPMSERHSLIVLQGLRPSKRVSELLFDGARAQKWLQRCLSRTPEHLPPSCMEQVLGVHVRMEMNTAKSLGVSASTVSQNELQRSVGFDQVRAACQWPHFVERIREAMRSRPELKHVLVASDSKEALHGLRSVLAPHVHVIALSQKSACIGRSIECVQFAAAEMFMLARSAAFIGSNFSSFSQVVRGMRASGSLPDGCSEESHSDKDIRDPKALWLLSQRSLAPGLNFQGHDISSRGVRTVGSCERACLHVRQCTAFSFISAARTRRCWLKQADPEQLKFAAVYSAGVISGIIKKS